MLGAEKLLHELQDKAGPGMTLAPAPCSGRAQNEEFCAGVAH